MRDVPVDELQEGQVTAQDVFDPAGNQLLKSGTKLTKVWIGRLKSRKVETVKVTDALDAAESQPVVSASAEDDADPLAAVMSGWDVTGHLDEMLAGVEDEGLRAKLRQAAVAYLKSRSWNPEA